MGFFLITFLRKRNVERRGEGIFSKLVSRIIDNGDKMEELSGIVGEREIRSSRLERDMG